MEHCVNTIPIPTGPRSLYKTGSDGVLGMCLWYYNMTMTYPDRSPLQPTRFGYFGLMLSSRDVSTLGALILPDNQTQHFATNGLKDNEIKNLKYAVSTHITPRSILHFAGIHKRSARSAVAMARHYNMAVQHIVTTYEAVLVAVNETDFLEHELMAGKTGGPEGGASLEFQQDLGTSMWSGQLNHKQEWKDTDSNYEELWRMMDKGSKKRQQQQGQKIGILTIAAPRKGHTMTNESSLYAAYYFALINHQRYAKLHNYRCFPVFSLHDETLAPTLDKIPFAMEYFDLYPDMEWLWLLDLDAFIMNKSISLEEHILNRIPAYASDQIRDQSSSSSFLHMLQQGSSSGPG
eukprot:gene14979-21037_t